MKKRTLLGAAVLTLMAGRAAAQEPMTVTTDTVEYCIALADRMGSEGGMPPHARVLWRNGRAMCEQGHVRDGLVRLRRAMLMLRGVAE